MRLIEKSLENLLDTIATSADTFVGFLISVLAGLTVLGGQWLWNKRKMKKRYGKSKGEYQCYKHTETYHLKEKPNNKAIIEYLGKNKLEITLIEKELDHRWKGEIFMESETKGSVAWRYTTLNGKAVDFEGQHKFGFKQLIVREDKGEQNMYVYLTGEKWWVEIKSLINGNMWDMEMRFL